MFQPRFIAVVDEIPEVSEQLVVCLGRPLHAPRLPEGGLLVLDEVDEAALTLLAEIDPTRMAAGLVIVTASAEHRRNPRNVLRAQKLLAYLYMKFVELPVKSTRIPDVMHLRPADTPPEYLHDLNRHRNMPLLLQHCLVDKLSARRVGLPCLLLLPGPSLKLLKERLPELARRYLIVTISRVLPFLRECGVEPDVLMQLDTVPIQEHFHHPDERFPRTVLLSLSLAPVRSFAPRFRRLFFMESFDLAVLPNPSRIRESWLSSLLACLGVAEALHAPKVLLAGADLRLFGKNIYYGDEKERGAERAYQGPMTSQGSLVALADESGREAGTSLHFFATAAETELFAREIRAALGTSFHSLSPWSLLDPDVFAPMTQEEALRAPELDKEPFLDKADEASAAAERVNLPLLRERCAADFEAAKRSRDILTCLRYSTDAGTIRQHPCHRYVAANVPWFRPSGEDNLLRLAANLAEELCVAKRFARNVAALHNQAAKGVAVPVLCTGEEEEETLAWLNRLRPGWSWRCLGISAPNTGRAEPSSGSLELSVLHDWMRFQDVLLVAPQCAGEFHYVLSLIKGDNVLDLEELLAYAPLV